MRSRVWAIASARAVITYGRVDFMLIEIDTKTYLVSMSDDMKTALVARGSSFAE
jgi:hypothetical protein